MTNKIPQGTGEFKLSMPIVKSYERDAHMFVAGLASGTGLDFDGERMADSAILAFKKAVDEGINLPVTGKWSLIPLRSGHGKEWDDVLGWVIKADVDENHNLLIEAELDDTSKARDLFVRLTGGERHGRPIQLGFSVGGTIKKARKEWDAERHKSVRVIEDISLKEISVVGQPAYPTAYVEALTKSVDWDEVPIPQEELKESSMTNPQAVVDGATAQSQVTVPTEQAQVATNTPQDANAQVQAAQATTPSEEVSTTDPQSNAPAGNAVEAAANNASVDVSAQIAALTKTVETLAAKVDALQPQKVEEAAKAEAPKVEESADKSATTHVAAEEAKVTKSIEDAVTSAVAAALAAFKVENIDPLATGMQAIKSAVDEFGGQGVDKSFSVRQAKETDDAAERFRKAVSSKNSHVSPIGAAIRASYEAKNAE